MPSVVITNNTEGFGLCLYCCQPVTLVPRPPSHLRAAPLPVIHIYIYIYFISWNGPSSSTCPAQAARAQRSEIEMMEVMRSRSYHAYSRWPRAHSHRAHCCVRTSDRKPASFRDPQQSGHRVCIINLKAYLRLYNVAVE